MAFAHYALTDHQFSVVALIDSAGNLIERVSYTPYGEARHHWRQDVDGDGDIDATDQSLVHAALNKRIYESGYNVDADFDRNGVVDSNDSRQIGSVSFLEALPAGWISSLSAGNVIGFSGYVFNREIDAGGLYTVRFRHYDPVWGRWISRDPAGYTDSMSLYGYGSGGPLLTLDPFGLWEWDGGWVEGFLTGAWHGIVMTADNLTGGLVPGLNSYADDIREENSDNPWYTAGDWSSFGGSVLLPWTAITKGLRYGGWLSRFLHSLDNRYFRIGWNTHRGQLVFRVVLGGGPNRLHLLDLFARGRTITEIVGTALWLLFKLWQFISNEQAAFPQPAPNPAPAAAPIPASTDSPSSTQPARIPGGTNCAPPGQPTRYQ